MTKNILFKQYFYITIGSILFACAINIFIVPYGLYNGGIVGTSQLIRSLINNYFNFNFDIAGTINLFLNIPIIFFAYKFLKKQFVYKTIYSIIIQTIAFSLCPIPSPPFISDRLASIIIGSIISAIGCGLVLVEKGSCGGNDVTGLIATLKLPKMSVGKLNSYYNIIIYLICAYLYSPEIAIYSLAQTLLYSFIVDKVHTTNIEVSVMIFTKNSAVKKMILEIQKRGVTYWKGYGAYTDSESEILVTIVSKSEITELKKRILQIDPKAFIVISGQLSVEGGFEKRLV